MSFLKLKCQNDNILYVKKNNGEKCEFKNISSDHYIIYIDKNIDDEKHISRNQVNVYCCHNNSVNISLESFQDLANKSPGYAVCIGDMVYLDTYYYAFTRLSPENRTRINAINFIIDAYVNAWSIPCVKESMEKHINLYIPDDHEILNDDDSSNLNIVWYKACVEVVEFIKNGFNNTNTRMFDSYMFNVGDTSYLMVSNIVTTDTGYNRNINIVYDIIKEYKGKTKDKIVLITCYNLAKYDQTWFDSLIGNRGSDIPDTWKTDLQNLLDYFEGKIKLHIYGDIHSSIDGFYKGINLRGICCGTSSGIPSMYRLRSSWDNTYEPGFTYNSCCVSYVSLESTNSVIVFSRSLYIIFSLIQAFIFFYLLRYKSYNNLLHN